MRACGDKSPLVGTLSGLIVEGKEDGWRDEGEFSDDLLLSDV